MMDNDVHRRFSPTSHSASNERDGLVNSLLSGFIATFAMSLATFGAYGLSRAFAVQDGNQLQQWFWMLTHNDIINSTQDRLAIAVGLDLLVGVALGVAYGFGVDRRLDGPGWRNGMLFSLAPWLLSILVFFPIMHAGIFGRNLHAGPLPVLGNLILHLIFGAVLGWAFSFDLESRLGDNEIDQIHNHLAERWALMGLAIGIPAGAIAGWLAAPSMSDIAGRPVVTLLAALIGATVGLAFGTFAGLEHGGRELDRHPQEAVATKR
jgi:hypothetical protein